MGKKVSEKQALWAKISYNPAYCDECEEVCGRGPRLVCRLRMSAMEVTLEDTFDLDTRG